MTWNIRGKTAIVTGSGQGIGRAIAVAKAKEGAAVVTNNRKPGSTGFAIMNESLIENLAPEKKDLLRKEAEMASGDAETTAKTIRDFGGEATAFFGDISDFGTAQRLVLGREIEFYIGANLLLSTDHGYIYSQSYPFIV